MPDDVVYKTSAASFYCWQSSCQAVTDAKDTALGLNQRIHDTAATHRAVGAMSDGRRQGEMGSIASC